MDSQLIVEGISERKYFTALKGHYHCAFNIIGGSKDTDSYSTCKISIVKNLMLDGISSNIKSYYVVDLDRIYFDNMIKEGKDYDNLKNSFSGNPNVVFCDSMPTFEIWLLMHYPEYNVRQYNKSQDVEKELSKYIPNYRKTNVDNYDLYSCDKLGQACHTAKTRRNISDNQSHSNVWKLIDDMDI